MPLDPHLHDAINAILDRLAKATGANRELDGLIWKELTGKPSDTWEILSGVLHRQDPEDSFLVLAPPALTASIDAALALVERVKPGWGHEIGKSAKGGARQRCLLFPGDDTNKELSQYAEAATEPLAIMTALLRAEIGS
jgi:hypothetical protein